MFCAVFTSSVAVMQPQRYHAFLRASIALIWLVIYACASSSGEEPTAAHGDTSMAIQIMPIGDSITTCCHACNVDAAILPRNLRHRAEPLQAFEGYMRPLWKKFTSMGTLCASSVMKPPWHCISTSSDDGSNHAGEATRRTYVRFVGRKRDCLFPSFKARNISAAQNDWPIYYEGYYGYTTSRYIAEGIASAAAQEAFIESTSQQNEEDGSKVTQVLSALPVWRVALLHLGTNDLIETKHVGLDAFGERRVSAAVSRCVMIVGQLLLTMAFGRSEADVWTKNVWKLKTESKNETVWKMRATSLRETYCDLLRSKSSSKLWSPPALAWAQLLPVDFGGRIGGTKGGKQFRVGSFNKLVREVFMFLTRNVTTTHEYVTAGSMSCPGGVTAALMALVDMNTGVDPRRHLHGDSLHPNELAETEVLASRYFTAIAAMRLLLGRTDVIIESNQAQQVITENTDGVEASESVATSRGVYAVENTTLASNWEVTASLALLLLLVVFIFRRRVCGKPKSAPAIL